jgi:hypothetical protein
VLLDLVDGRRFPPEVSDWASPWLGVHNQDVDDPVVWDALVKLSGADILLVTGQLARGLENFGVGSLPSTLDRSPDR